MICHLCKLNQASFQKFVPSIGRSVPICSACIYSAQGGFKVQSATVNIQTFMSGDGVTFIQKTTSYPRGRTRNNLNDYLTDKTGLASSITVCTNCASDFEMFNRTGRLGCSECYSAFEKQLAPLIKQIQG